MPTPSFDRAVGEARAAASAEASTPTCIDDSESENRLREIDTHYPEQLAVRCQAKRPDV
jgi:hypothetical protein